MEFFAKRIGDTLWAADDVSQVELARVPQDKLVHVEIRQERNGAMHRLYFVLVGIVARAFDEQPDDVDYKLRIAAGHYTEVRFPDGAVEKRPMTIRWAKMDQVAFGAFFENIVRVVYRLYGILPEDAQRELDAILAPDAERVA
jgi:hypothetical protein